MINCRYPTKIVYDDYWRFAAERQAVYHRRLAQTSGSLTNDPVISRYRFTNAYRASDRVSQYLIREVQYGRGLSQEPREVFFRTLLFKIFNKIETWELLEDELLELTSNKLNLIPAILNTAMARGDRIYSAAYIMPAPPMGEKRKHANHILLLRQMLCGKLHEKLVNSKSLEHAYNLLLAQPGFGKFLAFQYAIDLNYSSLMDHSEGEFVIAGPGALDGIAKCFDAPEISAEEIIMHMVEIQDDEFARLGLNFSGLFGRKLQPIDCQNLFCEISKYARVAHPDVMGSNGRTKIKQNFTQNVSPMAKPFFPPKWGLVI